MTLKPPSQRLTLLLAAALLAVTLALTLPVLAQDAVLEFVGELQGQTATTITVNGVTIDISSAEVDGPLALGALVKVEAVLVNNQYVAREVSAADDDDMRPDELELVGFVQAIDATTLLVGGQLVSLTGAEVGAGIDAGAVVRVHAVASENGWVAREVRLFNERRGDDSSGLDDDFDNDDFEIVGTLQGVGDGYIILSGQQLDVSQADVRGLLALGALVRVEYERVGGQWVITEVRSRGLPRGNDNSSGLAGNNDIFGNNDGGLAGNNEFFGNNDDSSGPRSFNVACGDVPNGWTTYAIVQGDTLSGIAARSGARLGDIVAANCIGNPNSVPVGTVLAVPRTPADRQLFFNNDDGSGFFGNNDGFGNDDGSGSFGNNDDRSGNRGRGGDNRSGGDNSSISGDNFSGNNDDDSSGSRRNRGSGGGDDHSGSGSH